MKTFGMGISSRWLRVTKSSSEASDWNEIRV
jgi:hypothetical protein